MVVVVKLGRFHYKQFLCAFLSVSEHSSHCDSLMKVKKEQIQTKV